MERGRGWLRLRGFQQFDTSVASRRLHADGMIWITRLHHAMASRRRYGGMPFQREENSVTVRPISRNQMSRPMRAFFPRLAPTRRAIALAPFAAAAAFLPQWGRAAEQEVDLQLVLAVDASGSVNMRRFFLQMRATRRHSAIPRCSNAIRSGISQAIAVTMIQWTGPRLQVLVVPWMVVKDEASAEALAAVIEKTPRKLFGGGTSISGAIDYSRLILAQSPFTATRRTIDVSGDGANNIGRPASIARDEAVQGRHHHQRAADRLGRARSRHLLFPERHRRSRRHHGAGRQLRELRRSHPEEAHHGDRGERCREPCNGAAAVTSAEDNDRQRKQQGDCRVMSGLPQGSHLIHCACGSSPWSRRRRARSDSQTMAPANSLPDPYVDAVRQAAGRPRMGLDRRHRHRSRRQEHLGRRALRRLCAARATEAGRAVRLRRLQSRSDPQIRRDTASW